MSLAVKPVEVALQRFEPDTAGGCHLWTGALGADGYGRISRGRAAPKILAHRASYAHHHGAIPDGMEVMHVCDTPSCVNPAHLRVGTHAQNMADMAAKGRAALTRHPHNVRRGVDHPRSQFIAGDVQAIRQRYANGETLVGLAKSYGVRFGSIHSMVTGQSFKREPGPITWRQSA